MQYQNSYDNTVEITLYDSWCLVVFLHIVRGRYWSRPQICEKIRNQTNDAPFCSYTCLDCSKKTVVVFIGGDLAAIFLKSLFLGRVLNN